jgi:hypothetical protein
MEISRYSAEEEKTMNKITFIGGSRHTTHDMIQAVYDYVQTLPPDRVVVMGDAAGVDFAAQNACSQYHLRYWVYGTKVKPRYYVGSVYGRYRCYGHTYKGRDEYLCMAGDSAALFWDGESKGTLANMARLKILEKPFTVWQGGKR